MTAEPRRVVVFRSDSFNTTEHKPYFINEGCFGDDLARWLIARLRAHGIETDEDPGQEDFGWYFRYRTHEGWYTLVLSFRPEGEIAGEWIGVVERDCGLIGTLLGGRNRGITQASLEVIHAALDDASEITAIAWHRRSTFDRGDETAGTAEPAGVAPSQRIN